ncbi:MAG: glycosyltransferase family 39 protein [Alphaproteobacteria bacterium]|nr:glycosyltransferase family 39 protein [Alphaproteobacteria bacterium]
MPDHGMFAGIVFRRLAACRWAAVAALLLVLAVELLVPAYNQAQTPDEANHLLSGIRYWTYGDFGSNPEHPPFAKLIAALPVRNVPCPPAAPYTQFFMMENFSSGAACLYTHDADAMLFRARTAIAVFTLALALLVFAAGSEMFGTTAGLIALMLFVFEPNLLAHGAMVTVDMAVTCCFFATVYAFYRWCKHPSVLRLVICGVAAGLTLACKDSGLFVLPVLFVLALVEMLAGPERRQGGAMPWLRMAGALAAIGLTAYAVLWTFYGFRYHARPGGLAMMPSLADYAGGQSPALQRIVMDLSSWHLLPEAYLFGFVNLAAVARRDPAFLLGVDYDTGRWFYFPLAFLIKATLGFLALLAVSPFLRALRRTRREIVFLLVPAVLYFAVSLFSSMDIGVRHILPVFPFLVVFAAAAAVALAATGRWGKVAAGTFIIVHVASSAAAFPDYIPYANEAWGGPSTSYRRLTDSNADWNQGLRAVASYLARNRIRDCWFAHYGWDVPPAYYGIPCKPLPEGISHWFAMAQPPVPPRITGVVLVSGSEADGDYWGPGDLNPYAQFLYRHPDAEIADSVLVFRGSFDVPELSAMAHMSAAQQLANRKQWSQALREIDTAVALWPKSAEAQATSGNILLAMNRPSEAKQAFQKALSLARKDHWEFQKRRLLHIPQ